MKHKKKSTMFIQLNSDEHNNYQAFDVTNANFKKVEKSLKKQDDQNFTFGVQIDSLQEQIDYHLKKGNRFKYNIHHIADISKKLSEIAIFPALLSIIYYCFK
jgi:hypothetical protein